MYVSLQTGRRRSSSGLCVSNFLLSTIRSFSKQYIPQEQCDWESDKEYLWVGPCAIYMFLLSPLQFLFHGPAVECWYVEANHISTVLIFFQITMRPFVELAWVETKLPCQHTSDTAGSAFTFHAEFTIQEHNTHPVPKLMGIWALESLSRSKENMKLIYSEGIYRSAVCHWYFTFLVYFINIQ